MRRAERSRQNQTVPAVASDLTGQQEEDDAALIIRAKQDDQDAWSELFKRHNKAISGFFRYKLSSLISHEEKLLELVKDCTQETFVSAAHSLNTYVEQGTFRAWIKKVAQRVYYKTLEKMKKDLDVQLRSFSEIPEYIVEIEADDERKETEAKDEIARILRGVSPDKRLIMYYHFVEGRTYKEIAPLVGKSCENVKMVIYRIRKDLKLPEKQTKSPSQAKGRSQKDSGTT